MPITCYHTCPECGHEIEVEVEIHDGDDLPDHCAECGREIPESVHFDMQAQALERLTDRATDRDR